MRKKISKKKASFFPLFRFSEKSIREKIDMNILEKRGVEKNSGWIRVRGGDHLRMRETHPHANMLKNGLYLKKYDTLYSHPPKFHSSSNLKLSFQSSSPFGP